MVALLAVLVYMLVDTSHSNFSLGPNESPILPRPSIETEVKLPNQPIGTIDSLLNEMEIGAIAFNAPTNINIDGAPVVQLILSHAETVEKLKQSISEAGKRVGAEIRVSDVMEAHLTGHMFEITAITDEKQAISEQQQTEWKWQIHPKEVGKHKLYLTLTAILVIDGRRTPRAIETFDSVIEVNVTATQKISLFLKNNWQWLWAALLAPIVGWLWRRRKTQLANTSSEK